VGLRLGMGLLCAGRAGVVFRFPHGAAKRERSLPETGIVSAGPGLGVRMHVRFAGPWPPGMPHQGEVLKDCAGRILRRIRWLARHSAPWGALTPGKLPREGAGEGWPLVGQRYE